MTNSASIWRTWLLTVVVALGLGAVWAFAIACAVSIAESARSTAGVYDQIYVAPDGEPYILRASRGAYGPLQEAEKLNGEKAQVQTQTLLNPMYVNPPVRNSTGQVSALAASQARLAAVNDGGAPPQYWYLVHDGRAGGGAYGVGYDSLTRQTVGYLGRKGFTDRMPSRSEWFDVAGQFGLWRATPFVTTSEPRWVEEHVLYWLADGKLWAADPAQRELRELADAPPGAAIGWVWDLSGGPQERPKNVYSTAAWAPRDLMLRSEESLSLVDPQSGEETTYPFPAELQQALVAGFRLADDGLLLVTYSTGIDQIAGEVVWLSPDGVRRREDVRLAQWTGNMGTPSAFGWVAAAAVPMPIGQVPTMFLLPLSTVEGERADSYWLAVRWMFGQFWPALLAVALVGVVAAVAAYRRQQRYVLPHAIGWAIFAFLFGAPGWIAYRFHRDWPVLEDCPSCGRFVPQDRERCTECLHAFPPPPAKGIEVFA